MKHRRSLFLSLLLAFLLISCGNNASSSSSSSSSSSFDESSSESESSLEESSSEETSSEEESESSSEDINTNTYTFLGAEDISINQGEYLSLYDGVKVINEAGNDVTHMSNVSGYFNYGEPGTYEVTYKIENQTKTRNITVLKDDDYETSNEQVFYTAKNPYNIALNRLATGTSNAGNTVDKMLDGSMNTRYETPHTEGPYEVVVDLGASLEFSKIKIYWEAASAKKYEILFSDDNITFTSYDIFTSTKNTRTDEIDLVKTARYIKLRLIERTMQYGYSIWEFEVYGLRGLPFPTSDYPDIFNANNIIDEQYLKIRLDRVYEIDKVKIDYFAWQNARHVYLEGSLDDETYFKLAENNQGWNELTFKLTAVRYIKINFLARSFNSQSYMVSTIHVKNGKENIPLQASGFSASSFMEGHEPAKALTNWGNYWCSQISELNLLYGQAVDLGKVTAIGDIDLKFANNFGKIFDIYCCDELPRDFNDEHIYYRELHGSNSIQTIPLYTSCRYIIIKEYSNPNSEKFQLQNMVIHAPYGDKVIHYNIGELPTTEVVKMTKGTYLRGFYKHIVTARLVEYVDDDLRKSAIDSNSWWNSLLINNMGSPLYTNPLRARYTKAGLDISLPGNGYFETSYHRSNTVSQAKDITIMPKNINKAPKTKVLGFDDFGVKVSFSDTKYDKMVNSIYSGTPFIYSYFLDDGFTILGDKVIEYLDLEGNKLQDGLVNNKTQIIIKTSFFETYENGVQQQGNKQVFKDRYHLISVPNDATIEIAGNKVIGHFKKNRYLSTASFDDISVAQIYANKAYAFIENGYCDYEVINNLVYTEYNYTTRVMEGENSQTVLSLLPHQWKKSPNDFLTYIYKTIRGPMKNTIGNSFKTIQKFDGIAPQYGEPTNTKYSHDLMVSYLEQYDNMTNGNLFSDDPYWQGKSLHPLSQAAFEADCLGLIGLRDRFVKKLRTILEDWFSYGGENDRRYFYYDNEWGTLYYPVSEFGANFNLADHHFTYGYLVLAANALCSFDKTFYSEYADMVMLLIKDYMNYTDDVSEYCRFRNYDMYAGHSWAGGYGDGDAGNNQESASEALNSWASCYLYATTINDKDMRDAAIFGYVTELNAVKQYWFNYDNDSYNEAYPYHGVGQIYGGSNFYGTFFNGDPTYIYGIQLLPCGEYLAGYVIGDEEKTAFKELYDDYLNEEYRWTGHEGEDGYQHIWWVSLAWVDPDAAIDRLEKRGHEINKGAEWFNTYYMIHALKTYGTKTSDFDVKTDISYSIYKNNNEYKCMVFNPSNVAKEINFYQNGVLVNTCKINPHTFGVINPLVDKEYIPPKYGVEPLKGKDSINKVDNGETTIFTFDIVLDKGDYRFAVETINTTQENIIVYLKDENDKLIDAISCTKQENGTFYSKALHMAGRYKIKLEISNKLIFRSCYFENL